MDFVVVLNPSVDELEWRFGLRWCSDADEISLQCFTSAGLLLINRSPS